MRNNSFFEKITGSIRLSDDDLNALDEREEKKETTSKNTKLSNTPDGDFEIIESDDEFEIPDDAEIETIEEVIEDDSIDEEEIEEYYEEIVDEDEKEDVSLYENESNINDDSNEDDDYPVYHLSKESDDNKSNAHEKEQENLNQVELPIDVFTMHNEVVLRILVPGITPENLKVSITRNHVSLMCTRPSPEGIDDSNYFDREIPYGDFTRTIHLPSDVDVEKAEAVEKYGLLIIRLPMLDAKKVQELKIKSF